jgi:flagellin-like protein
MSEKTMRMRQRRQNYLRRLRGEKKAVSPVVATLILILIAVAAAAALYLWLVVWQGNITGGIGQPTAQYTLSIGGSTSVYPFDSLAVTQFEQNNSDTTISNNQGGSGAGMIAVCANQVDLGAASFPVDVPTLMSTYGCPASAASTIVVTTVAYDAVDIVTSSSNTHGLLSMNYDTLSLVYADATVTAGGAPKLIPTTENGQTIPAGIPVPSAIGAGLTWQDIPAAVQGASVGAGPTIQALAPGATWTAAACGAGALAHTECYTAGGAAASTCGFTVCATGANLITTWARSDASGTTQSFEARLIDAATSTTFASATQLNEPGSAGFSGCGSSNYISDCGFVATSTANGNPGVISGVAGDVNGIGYASDGLARASGSGVVLTPFIGVGQSASTDGALAAWYGGILPTTGGSGTIALGILAPTHTTDYATGYLGWRPFDLVSLTALSGTAQRFVTFVMDPANNINLAAESQEISVYSV